MHARLALQSSGNHQSSKNQSLKLSEVRKHCLRNPFSPGLLEPEESERKALISGLIKRREDIPLGTLDTEGAREDFPLGTLDTEGTIQATPGNKRYHAQPLRRIPLAIYDPSQGRALAIG
ncbi:hypothetical protein RRG08_028360 [Elysia crispata]|uniref:Uncharacterized protein n=1 Tax=Elysia crispata TaxID=231223 RepID=A0AAE1AXP8_9GAST|nr:hypothetical protein RRG08_028360 [Elysia crispata]